ncbi:sulfite exporter TauE/SafE family protein [Francisella adeliensis]|uniref:Probable membrane transporter protein n=1 Tax=Francisella adeliensis TaxID=2007306 RepID=A0A2Z4XXJ5_9GAMM|nr:sulfite exporter TauE/SafE family protein [Francisella adeliensis]AXA33456.1 permease [Francisella adeliensis]MBK2085477.1 sulfite exporter TauE/SafE family protein [Francisella adeliensis]MBK2097207.1 sulfite exporter TauE/SafE family protein [Francisella adeliensis]QIW11685.1 sulfite exporter TauE/SafE family protein [Francisella adeliensis]QIW13559.1 sulfite exporter TauE/SafE family protein [Francisella adeliensis]
MTLIIFGLICGIALGLTGGGGSILAVPLLTYGVGLDFHSAVTISLLVVGFTAIFGIAMNYKNLDINFLAAAVMIVTGVVFAPIGTYVSQSIADETLMTSFSMLMVIIGVWSLIKSRFMPNSQESKNDSVNFKYIVSLLIGGAIVGTLTGFFGVGGGFLIVPALIFITAMPIKRAISTSLLVIFVVSISGFISHYDDSSMSWYVASLFILGGMVGMFIANKLKAKLNDKILQLIFSIMLVVLGITIYFVN